MPGPPPPPPPGPPPPPAFSPFSGGGGGGADDRGALLKSIRQGAKLKKTVTNDKSAPLIPGKEMNNSSGAASIGAKNSAGGAPSSMPNGINLGGLFAGGMPKLKATGLPGASTLKLANNSNSGGSNDQEVDRTPSPKTATSRNFNSVQDQLKKQLHNPSDTRTRGPPPPAPVRNISVDDSRPAKPFTLPSNQVSNGLHSSQTSLQANVSSLHANSSTLHRKSKSNANLNAFDCTDNMNNVGFHQQQMSKPVINHGKPNLAPKPPILNGKPAHPTKLAVKPNKSISRAQSMRSPRSPSPQSPTANSNANVKFGTVRHLSSAIGQSLTNLNSQNTVGPRQRPPLTARPSVPPPSVPPPAAPSVKMAPVKPPSHAPPPPPVLPQPPSHAPPPPPPHKTLQPSRPSPDIPSSNNVSNNSSSNPPPPPPRFSSMRDVNQQPPRRVAVDLEEKFRAAFCTPDRFPRPPPYRNVLKLYSNKQAASSKQPAPLPPQLQLHSGNKTWSPTSTC